MVRVRWSQVLVGLLLLAGAMSAGVHHRASAQTTRESKSESRPLDKTLAEILATQQSILQKLDAVMEELQVVKVRCTR